MVKQKIEVKLDIPEGVQVSLENGAVKVSSGDKSVSKRLHSKKVKISAEGNQITIVADNATRRESTMVGTFKAHLQNMFKGVTEGHTYKLKICSGHFPMNVSIANNEMVVKNFLGEAVPRTLKLDEGAKVELNGNDITVSSVDKELAGTIAGKIESLSKITGRDLRIFQDGIYIVEKDGKSV